MLTGIALPIEVLTGIAMALEIQSQLLPSWTVRKGDMVVRNFIEEMDLLLW
jgi:hypothetical protein